jgi:hypothetical membrane protein
MDQNDCKKPSVRICYRVMERPKGVTVMARVFFFMGWGVFQNILTRPPDLQRKHLAFYLANVLILVILGIGLLKMQRWSRWLAVVGSVAWLVFIPRQVHTAHGPAILGFLLRTLFSVWVIWYLFRSHVKAAFRNATSTLASTSQS